MSGLLCSSSYSSDKNVLFKRHKFDRQDKGDYYQFCKNDNYHPYIPKLVSIYKSILSRDVENIKSYLKDNNYVIHTILNLTFNKLKSFLKLKVNLSDEQFQAVIDSIKENKFFYTVFGFHKKLIDKLLQKYNDYDSENRYVFVNFRLFKMLIDILENCQLFEYNKDEMDDQIDRIQKSPFGSIFSMSYGFVGKKILDISSKKINMSGFQENPYLPSDAKFEEVEEFIATNCNLNRHKLTLARFPQEE